ncbi:hypothetical protein OG455_37510 [Kitasatospora sp. NBC_01287]|uniref:hypothetical protein n=1 Tax=Kitasatospora sp. NBC_01287 TaxID=2903573 RepID=UPI0022548D42|nr:hypothetical protein [Kitasatospora sp. NBC_01287]MCX4751140.1 hypothetical protein [Kitasatospora sp. NBC_01287]
MVREWFGLMMGLNLAVLGVRTLNGWQPEAFKRPRLGGWAGVVGGVWLAGAAVLSLTGLIDRIGGAGWLLLGPVLAAAVLFVASGPVTRFSRRRGPRSRSRHGGA